MAKRSTVLMIIVVLAFSATGCSRANTDSVASDASTTTVTEAVSDTPVSVAPADDNTSTTEPATSTTTNDGTTTEVDDPIACDAPVGVEHYVDVALDDPDGGLNMRTAAGVSNDIVVVIPRSEALVTTGGCETLGTFDWWEVTTPDAASTGWVSSRFLSNQLVFNPGLGKAIIDTDNVGIGGETLDELAAELADAYGFDDDVVVTMIGEPEGADAIGGSVVYELTGLKDDASNGYRVEIDFIFDKNETEEGSEIVGYTAAAITNYSLCTRGVTDDGLCI